MPKCANSPRSAAAARVITRRRLFVPGRRTAPSPPLVSPTTADSTSVEPPLVLFDAGGVCVVQELLALVLELAESMSAARISSSSLCSTSWVSSLSFSLQYSAAAGFSTEAAGGADDDGAALCLRVCVACAVARRPRLVVITIARSGRHRSFDFLSLLACPDRGGEGSRRGPHQRTFESGPHQSES